MSRDKTRRDKQRPDYDKIWMLEEEMDLPHTVDEPRDRGVQIALRDRELEDELLGKTGQQ